MFIRMVKRAPAQNESVRQTKRGSVISYSCSHGESRPTSMEETHHEQTADPVSQILSGRPHEFWKEPARAALSCSGETALTRSKPKTGAVTTFVWVEQSVPETLSLYGHWVYASMGILVQIRDEAPTLNEAYAQEYLLHLAQALGKWKAHRGPNISNWSLLPWYSFPSLSGWTSIAEGSILLSPGPWFCHSPENCLHRRWTQLLRGSFWRGRRLRARTTSLMSGGGRDGA